MEAGTMSGRKKIYASGEDYLEAVLILQKGKSVVRSVDLPGTWGSASRA